MKITTRDKKLLLFAGGLILFLVVYMYVFTPLQDQTNAMQMEIDRLERECRELESQNTDIDTYVAKIIEYRETNQEIMDMFPVAVKEEDILVYLLDLQKDNELQLFSIGLNAPVPVMEFDGVIVEDGQDKKVHMLGQQVSVSTSTEFSYEDMKKLLNYIYETKSQTTLESMSIVYDAGREMLSSSLNFTKYALSYDGAIYVPEQLPKVEIGQDNPFASN